MKIKVIGTGSSLPQKVVTNVDLTKTLDTSDEWIRERTGVESRHVVSGKETTVTMAVNAAKKAMDEAGISADLIDLIIVSTISSNVIIPGTACEVQREIGAINAACFDLSAACSGFVFALNTAQAYMEMGVAKTALVIGSESLSNIVDWTDRSSCILFGDGAGAAIVTKAEGASYMPVMHSDGKKGEVLSCKSRNDIPEVIKNPKDFYTTMDGREVFRFAVKTVPDMIKDILAKNDLEKEDISYFLLHQANIRIVESIVKRLKLPSEKFPVNIQTVGNTSSASIPILLDELNKENKLKPGDKILLAGFGAGLSWGASIIEW